MAVTLTEADIPSLLNITDTQAARVFPVAKALVQRYCGASTVPDAISDESLLRVAGYMNGSVHHPGMVSRRVDDLSIRYTPRLTGVLTRSGAEALLSSFVTRRAIS